MSPTQYKTMTSLVTQMKQTIGGPTGLSASSEPNLNLRAKPVQSAAQLSSSLSAVRYSSISAMTAAFFKRQNKSSRKLPPVTESPPVSTPANGQHKDFIVTTTTVQPNAMPPAPAIPEHKKHVLSANTQRKLSLQIRMEQPKGVNEVSLTPHRVADLRQPKYNTFHHLTLDLDDNEDEILTLASPETSSINADRTQCTAPDPTQLLRGNMSPTSPSPSTTIVPVETNMNSDSPLASSSQQPGPSSLESSVEESTPPSSKITTTVHPHAERPTLSKTAGRRWLKETLGPQSNDFQATHFSRRPSKGSLLHATLKKPNDSSEHVTGIQSPRVALQPTIAMSPRSAFAPRANPVHKPN